jgi:hypothetical protein
LRNRSSVNRVEYLNPKFILSTVCMYLHDVLLSPSNHATNLGHRNINMTLPSYYLTKARRIPRRSSLQAFLRSQGFMHLPPCQLQYMYRYLLMPEGSPRPACSISSFVKVVWHLSVQRKTTICICETAWFISLSRVKPPNPGHFNRLWS